MLRRECLKILGSIPIIRISQGTSNKTKIKEFFDKQSVEQIVERVFGKYEFYGYSITSYANLDFPIEYSKNTLDKQVENSILDECTFLGKIYEHFLCRL